MSSTVSTRRDARRNHERLLVEARRLFAERGVDAPLDELATRAEVGAGTVYRHFPTRDDLIRELYDSGIDDMRELIPEVVEAETGWRSIELWLEKLSAWLIERPYLPAVMRRVAELDPEHRPGTEFQSIADGVVARAQAEGSLRSDVTSVDLSVLVDMLGSLGQYGGAYVPYWRRQLAVVLDGLRVNPDAEELPGAAQGFREFHEMSHNRRRAD
ncbi:TetR/AcrR family transcriptional regulator [Agromyces sp. SYSU T0242]|uniref:TetR/AcrR family transcriptional regulator n=1 Tax=Agromyces litoreus TaxID=3158561 RepID=UPI00339AC5E5